MTTTISKLDRESCEFRLSNADVDLALRVQKALSYDIATLAIRFVYLEINEGKAGDEFVAHRFGLVPVVFAGGNVLVQNFFTDNKRCKCPTGECSACSVEFVFDFVSDGRPFTTDDCRSPRAELRPGIDMQLFTKPGQRIRGRAVAMLGRGETKHQPTAPVVPFWNPGRVVLNPARVLDTIQSKTLVESCPERVFALTPGGRVFVKSEEDCSMCDECVRKGLDFRDSEDDEDLVRVDYDPTTFLFRVETTGQMCVGVLMRAMVDSLRFDAKFDARAADEELDRRSPQTRPER